jgi:2,3-bisphosphoglycerate-dependent phosphoglycerate mutase
MHYHTGMKREHLYMRRRALLTPVWLAVLGGVLACAVLLWAWSRADVTTIVVIRHAEKELDSIEDPPLSSAGEARAAMLARMLGDPEPLGRIDAIYSTPLRRSRSTAEPLAVRLRLEIQNTGAANPRQIAAKVLAEHRGQRVLIVGHSNTVPAIVAALSGGRAVAPMSELEFGTMYIVSVPRLGDANVLKLSY